MKISVVIPVYNAERYVRSAVESALAQPEVAEIVLIEDGSPDDSLAVCEQLARESIKVKLYRHPNRNNLGAGPTRTLGIQKSQQEWIAFLDADDFYLANRFTHATYILDKQPDVDGVYSAIGVHFETEVLQAKWINQNKPMLTTIEQPVAPEDLFEWLVKGNGGYFHGDGLLVNRRLLEKVGAFDDLRLHQDFAMWVKLSAMGRLMGVQLDTPVAMRRVHEDNRISAERSRVEQATIYRMMWEVLWLWGLEHLSSDKHELLFGALMQATQDVGNTKQVPLNRYGIATLIRLIIEHSPTVIQHGYIWRWLRHHWRVWK